jgi:tetratricopeptide (TPR) repeat protein
MAAVRRNDLQAVERLLKQGKLPDALAELQRVSDRAGADLLTLNRLGDLLARQGCRAEAIEYYQKIAGQFASGGFVPKAIAIYKKILRLDSQNLHSIIHLGELYLKENLQGEARNYLLHAANRFLENQEFDKAHEIFERLVAADPKDVRHKVRMAEARAAAGGNQEAGEELLALGRTLLDEDKAQEAEGIYRRAAELLPDSHLPTLGLARCLTQMGRAEAALEMLEQAVSEPTGSPAVLGELAICYDAVGRPDDALNLLAKLPVLDVPQSVWRTLLEGQVARGRSDSLWEGLDSGLQGDVDPRGLASLLEALGETEADGHIPALQRLLDLRRKGGDRLATVRTLETLVRAYDARSMVDEASLMREELATLAPPEAPASPSPTAPAEPKAAIPLSRGVSGGGGGMVADVEAPAVPLNRADEEFVAGRLTQAEVLEKYGLCPQALEQLEEVTSRYPGHVGAQESRIALLRTLDDPRMLHEALAQLAIARRAEGDVTGAQEAAQEAAAGGIPASATTILRELGLLVPDETAQDESEDGSEDDVDLVIDFDASPEAEETPEPQPRVPAEAVAEESAPAVVPPTTPEVREDAGQAEFALGDDEDLRAIAEALESELFESEEEIAPEEESAQAFEQVLNTFKERISEEVAQDDYRTHYDLAIAYKEMGLVDEAIREFQVAASSRELHRDACTMVAVCYREQSQHDKATRWYRQALESSSPEDDSRNELRYDLAEVLLEAGDARAALEEFRELFAVDPEFRDVDGRVSELEGRLRS